MRRAKVIYRMKDRSDYEFTVEGMGQREWLQAAEKLLIITLEQDGKMNTTGAIIDTFQTIPEDAAPGRDKQDGVAIRSAVQKVRTDLMPEGAMALVARVFTFGAYNYGDQNWRNGFSWSRCIGAAERHFKKWKMGQDLDEESRINHLAHSITNQLFLLEFQLLGLGTDDRIKYPDDMIRTLLSSFSVNENQ